MVLPRKLNKKISKENSNLKKLKKSMKERKRYVRLRVNKNINLKEEVESLILDFSGVLGFSKVCLKWIKIEENESIISINRKGLELFKASLCLSKENIEILGVSGTLKGLKKYK